MSSVRRPGMERRQTLSAAAPSRPMSLPLPKGGGRGGTGAGARIRLGLGGGGRGRGWISTVIVRVARYSEPQHPTEVNCA